MKTSGAMPITKEANLGKLEIIDMALQLKASERYDVAEKILQSLDKSAPEFDGVWAHENGFL